MSSKRASVSVFDLFGFLPSIPRIDNFALVGEVEGILPSWEVLAVLPPCHLRRRKDAAEALERPLDL